MDGEPTAVSAMTDDEFADFTDQMRLLVFEESYLWELPMGSRDLVGDDEWLYHGAWRQEDCSAAVHVWFDAGLVSLLRRWPEEQPLATSEAREVLAARESWVLKPERLDERRPCGYGRRRGVGVGRMAFVAVHAPQPLSALRGCSEPTGTRNEQNRSYCMFAPGIDAESAGLLR